MGTITHCVSVKTNFHQNWVLEWYNFAGSGKAKARCGPATLHDTALLAAAPQQIPNTIQRAGSLRHAVWLNHHQEHPPGRNKLL
jgi:hypothetical protein